MRLRYGAVADLRTPLASDDDLFSQHVREYADERPVQRIQILEAGCGAGDGLALDHVERRLVGVDMDLPRLHAHTRGRHDLDAWTLGDLRTVPMPPRVYDIVHVPYLLERVQHTELLLDRFVAAMKPGGLLLVRFRDRESAFGFLDRKSPTWLRRLFWRLIFRRGAVAGPRGAAAASRETADGPLPAVYESIASLNGIRWYCVMRGLVVSVEYATRDCVSALGRWSRLADRACRIVERLSRGRLTARHSEVALVIRKPENRFLRMI